MSFSLGSSGYALRGFLSRVPLVVLSGATYSCRHFSQALSGSNLSLANRFGHFFIGLLEMPPIVGGVVAAIDWYLHKNVTGSPPPSAERSTQSAEKIAKDAFPPGEKKPQTPAGTENVLEQEKVLNALSPEYRSPDSPGGNNRVENSENLFQDYDPELEAAIKESEESFALKEGRAANVFAAMDADQIANSTVQPAISLETYIEQDYNLRSPKAPKFRSRLEAIGHYFNKNTIHRVRGDGNCFFNAAVAGLLTKANRDPAFRKTLLEKLRDFRQNTSDYVTPKKPEDPAFNKQKDFDIVSGSISNGGEGNVDLLFEERNAAFARILRYMCFCQQALSDLPVEDRVSNIAGEDASYRAIGILNKLFDLKAYCAVVGKDSGNWNFEKGCHETVDVTSDKPENVSISSGEEIRIVSRGEGIEYEYVDCTQPTPKSQSSDFVLLLKGGHYTCLAPSSDRNSQQTI